MKPSPSLLKKQNKFCFTSKKTEKCLIFLKKIQFHFVLLFFWVSCYPHCLSPCFKLLFGCGLGLVMARTTQEIDVKIVRVIVFALIIYVQIPQPWVIFNLHFLRICKHLSRRHHVLKTNIFSLVQSRHPLWPTLFSKPSAFVTYSNVGTKQWWLELSLKRTIAAV